MILLQLNFNIYFINILENNYYYPNKNQYYKYIFKFHHTSQTHNHDKYFCKLYFNHHNINLDHININPKQQFILLDNPYKITFLLNNLNMVLQYLDNINFMDIFYIFYYNYLIVQLLYLLYLCNSLRFFSKYQFNTTFIY